MKSQTTGHMSLTGQVVKLMGRMIPEHLLEFYGLNDIFTCEQHGFQSRCYELIRVHK